jgi:hypothetical protein
LLKELEDNVKQNNINTGIPEGEEISDQRVYLKK